MIKSIEVNVSTGERTEVMMSAQEESDALARIAADDAAKPAKDRTEFIKQVDADADTVIKAVMGERATEYLLAEQEATAYRWKGWRSSACQPARRM